MFVLLAMQVLGGANTGIHTFNVELASLLATLLETGVLIMGMVIISSAGGQGIQKPLRQAIFLIGIGALFAKGYAGITTGAMGLF